ncbi:hypothetical protein [Stenotrophomonas sp. NRRL B-14846]|uniref:hypothetical protein n=1 Tax=Stenotrophomonas sp. NRRL B-14846 TaxID=3162882 RepID=UPI003D2B6C0B
MAAPSCPAVAELIVHQTLLMGIGVLLGGRRLALGRRLRFDLPTLVGMAMGFGLIGLFGLFYYAGFTAWVQDYPRGGNPLGQLLGGTLFIAATVAFGLFVGSFFAPANAPSSTSSPPRSRCSSWPTCRGRR